MASASSSCLHHTPDILPTEPASKKLKTSPQTSVPVFPSDHFLSDSASSPLVDSASHFAPGSSVSATSEDILLPQASTTPTVVVGTQSVSISNNNHPFEGFDQDLQTPLSGHGIGQLYSNSNSHHKSATTNGATLNHNSTHRESSSTPAELNDFETEPFQAEVTPSPTSTNVPMFSEESKQSSEQKTNSSGKMSQPHSATNSRSQSPAKAASANADTVMSTSSSTTTSTAASTSTSSSSSSHHHSTAHPKPNHSSKHTDPAGQSISDAELQHKFKVIRYLGKGSYGTVFVAEELATGKQVAIKKIPKCFDNLTNAKRLLREIKILRMLAHHNVIGYRGLLAPVQPAIFNSLLIVFEFVDTDLAKLLASDQPITNQHVQYFLYQLLCGINYIHSANIIHRDIKPANVLINADCSLKICDFGLSRSTLGPNPTAAMKKAAEDDMNAAAKKQAADLAAAPKLQHQRQVSTEKVSLAQPQKLARELTKHVVTRWYRAPEVILLSDRYTTAIDMWSIGCIFSELLSMQTRTSRRALFPGRTCFPFSADNNPLAYTDQLDQLNVIFDVIGTPTKEEIEKIDNDRARSYLRSLPFKPKIDLPNRYKDADPLAVDLLQKLLYFDPSKRFTAKQALEHPYLNEFRQAEDEGVYKGGSVDFAFEDQPVTKDQIKSLIVDQILIDNSQLKLLDFFPNGTTVGSAALSTQAAAAAAKEAKEAAERAEVERRRKAAEAK